MCELITVIKKPLKWHTEYVIKTLSNIYACEKKNNLFVATPQVMSSFKI